MLGERNNTQELKLHMEGINDFADLLSNAATGLAKMFRRLRTSLSDLINVFSNETYQLEGYCSMNISLFVRNAAVHSDDGREHDRLSRFLTKPP